MAWTTIDTEEIEESVAGDGVRGKTFSANPGETIQFDFERTDGGANHEPWLAAVDVSVENGVSGWSDPHHRTQRLLYNELRPTITVSRHTEFSAWVQNDDAAPNDKVKAKIHVKKDGVSL